MSIRWADFKFTNGTIGVGPFKAKQTDEDLLAMKEHAWALDGKTVYVYMTGDIPEDELNGAQAFCARQAAAWK